MIRQTTKISKKCVQLKPLVSSFWNRTGPWYLRLFGLSWLARLFKAAWSIGVLPKVSNISKQTFSEVNKLSCVPCLWATSMTFNSLPLLSASLFTDIMTRNSFKVESDADAPTLAPLMECSYLRIWQLPWTPKPFTSTRSTGDQMLKSSIRSGSRQKSSAIRPPTCPSDSDLEHVWEWSSQCWRLNSLWQRSF